MSLYACQNQLYGYQHYRHTLYTGNSHYITYFMTNLCFWECFRSPNPWCLRTSRKLVPQGSVLFWKVVMWHVKFSLSVHRNTCFVRLLLYIWQDNIPRMAETPLLIWQTERYHTTRGDVFKYTAHFLPGWAVKLFSGAIIKNVHE